MDKTPTIEESILQAPTILRLIVFVLRALVLRIVTSGGKWVDPVLTSPGSRHHGHNAVIYYKSHITTSKIYKEATAVIASSFEYFLSKTQIFFAKKNTLQADKIQGNHR